MSPRPAAPVKAKVYLEKSRRFATAAERAYQDGQWDPAASAAVHAVVNAAHAASARYLGQRSNSHDHAVDLVRAIEGPDPDEVKRFAKHLERLLALKNLAEYQDELMNKQEAGQAVKAMQRAMAIVEAWAKTWH